MIKQLAPGVRQCRSNANVRGNTARKDYSLVILLALVGSAVAVWSLLVGEGSFVIIFLLLLTIGVFWSWQAGREGRSKYLFLVRLFVVAFAIRVVFALGMHVFLLETTGTPYLTPGPSSSPDDIKFDIGAASVADAWRSGEIPNARIVPDPHARLYYYLLGTLYYLADFVGGTSMFGIILVHCFIGALIPVYVSKLAGCLYGLPEAKLAGTITVLFPDFILHSSVLLRDMLIALLILLVVWELTAYLLADRRWYRLIVVVFIVGYVLPALREATLAAMVVVVPLCLLVPTLSRSKLDRRQRQRIALGGVVGLLLLSVLIPTFAGSWKDITVKRLQRLSPDEVAVILRQRASSDSLSAQMLSLPQWLRFPAQAVYTALYPFPPWGGFFDKLARLQQFVGSLSGLVWYILLPYWFAGVAYSIRVDKSRLFPIYGTGILWIVGLGLQTAFHARYRLMVMPLILIVAAVGWHNRRRYTQLPKLWSLFLFGAFGVYSVLKLLAGGDPVIVTMGMLFCLGIIGLSLSILPYARHASDISAD